MQLADRDLEVFCTQLVRDLGLILPLEPEQLCQRLGAQRGRPIRMVGADLGGPHSVGHLIALPDRDTIFYDLAAPRALQIQVVCHEVVHLARGHLEDQAELACGSLLPDPSQPDESTQATASLYAEWKEWEAEFGATLLARLAHAHPEPARPADDAEVGLAAAFGLQPPGHGGR